MVCSECSRIVQRKRRPFQCYFHHSNSQWNDRFRLDGKHRRDKYLHRKTIQSKCHRQPAKRPPIICGRRQRGLWLSAYSINTTTTTITATRTTTVRAKIASTVTRMAHRWINEDHEQNHHFWASTIWRRRKRRKNDDRVLSNLRWQMINERRPSMPKKR